MREVGLAIGFAIGAAVLVEICRRLRRQKLSQITTPTNGGAAPLAKIRKRRTIWMLTREDDIQND
jgi:surfactin synthase thioesterase subunit